MKTLKAGLAALAFVLAPALGWAQNAIQSVTTNVQSGSEVIRIELSQPLGAVPGGFSIQSPPRIAIDLPGVGNATGRSSLDVNQGNLRSVNIAQSGERTRLVLNLKQATNYTAELQGNTLLLVLSPSAASAAVPTRSEPVQFAQSRNVDQQPLQDIDFRRGEDGAGRVVVQLPTSQVGVDIRQQGQSLVVEFLRSGLPDALRRRLDVTDFGTPVQTITAFQSGDRVRMVIEPRGQWEHSAYQSDNQFVVEVRPVRPDPNRLVQGPGPGYQGERLSLNFQNIEVRSLLQVIADFTDFNVVTSDSVTGNVTLRLRDVPWDQALDIILEAKGLGMRRTGNVLWIAPKDELAAKEKADLESKAQVAQLEPLRTQGFQLNYAKAEEIAKALLGQSEGLTNAKPILTPRGSVIFEQRTNQIFVTDIPSKLEELQDLIAKIDTPVRQVLIEARIVEAADTFGKSLGVRLGATDLRGLRGGTPGFGVGGSSRIMPGGSYIGVGEQTVQAELTGESFIPNSYFLNLPATGQLGFNPASFALSLFSSSANRFLNLEISALEADGKGKIISSPRVITADQRKAVIQQGTELPYQTATSSGATAIQFRQATLKLEVTPQITPEGNVILDVDVTKDSVGQNTAAGFAIDTKAVQTQVLVENGGTVVIGGIYEQTDRTDISKVPLLGDLPGVGALFRQRTQSANKSELLVFLTPKIISERDSAR